MARGRAANQKAGNQKTANQKAEGGINEGMKATDKKRALKRIAAVIVAELILAAAVVWLLDPFYQYHEPFFGLEAVLNDRENQMAGTIRNFRYDSLLVGSSVAENFDTEQLNEAYGCNALKVIRASGSMADLLYYVEMAEERQELGNIFWCLDIFAMNASPEVQMFQEGIPRYLYTATPLDDLPYLYNKEILLEKIPAMIVSSVKGINTGGAAYNWAADKNFSAEGAMRWYDRPKDAGKDIVKKDPELYRETVRENVNMLAGQLAAHPEIQYRFLVPPYSMLWWDCAWVNGEEEERLYILEETLTMLLSFDNAEVYYFQNDRDIICNLDNYMDMIHYSPEINRFMLEEMQKGNYRLTGENREAVLEDMRNLVREIHEKEIYRYY